MVRKLIPGFAALFILLLGGLLIYRLVTPSTGKGSESARQSLAAADGSANPSQGQGNQVTPQPVPDIVVSAPVRPVAVDLSALPRESPSGNSKYERWLRGEIDLEREYLIDPAEMERLKKEALAMPPSSAVQQMLAGPGLNSPVVGVNFDALDVNGCCGGSGATVPPDPELSAGPNHLIAVVNVAFEIYDKNGNSLVGPVPMATFFNALGGTNCTGTGPFDPNTLYDEEADRFMIAVDGDGKAYCMAVSQTSDPTGSWWLYEFPTDVGGRFFDYPHAGVGRDAIYMGANMFLNGNFSQGRVWAFDKAALYAGQATSSVSRTTANDGTPQPANLHGFQQGTWPNSGPHYILTDGNFDGFTYALYSWDDPFGNNTLAFEASLDLKSVHGVNVGMPVDNVQAGNGGTITGNDYRVLDFEFRNGSGWTAMTVSCNPGGGVVNCVQWAEIDLSGAFVRQAAVFASNGDFRYFPDIAANQCGDAAVGYTRSNATSFPSVWATGRQSSDPLNTMQAEVQVKGGEITYTAFADRWGDYTGMTIDPDGLRFWYLGEYSKNVANNGAKWGTGISSFTFPGCVAAPDFVLSATPPTQKTCVSSDISYTISVGSNGGFSTPVTLTAAGVPAGYNPTFDVNPVTPPGTAVLTLNAVSTASPGQYGIAVVGMAPTLTHTVTVGLELAAGVPGTPGLQSPADGANSVPLTPTFSWAAAPGATDYLLEVAADAAFSSIIHSATTAQLTYQVPVSLAANTSYFWRVTGRNACGAGATSQVFSFTTVDRICRSPGLAIPDNDPAGIQDTMVVTSTGTILDLDVDLDLSHTWVGDLTASLLHEASGTQVRLIERPGVPGISQFGCGNNDIVARIDDEGLDGSVETTCAGGPALFGTLTPFPDALQTFDGEGTAGNWSLIISDTAGFDTGVLNSWCLIPATQPAGAAVDLRIAKAASASAVLPGEPLTYTLSFSNAGQLIATGVMITDVVPAELTQVAVNSSGATITPTLGVSLTFRVEDLSPGEGGTITITGIISPGISADATMTNRATIAGAQPDQYPASNSAETTTLVAVPRVQFARPTYIVAENGGNVTMTVTLDKGNPYADIRVSYDIVGGTAISSSDYVAASGMLTFTAGAAALPIPIVILDDTLLESPETIVLNLLTPHGAQLAAPSTATVLIRDEDSHPLYMPVVAIGP